MRLFDCNTFAGQSGQPVRKATHNMRLNNRRTGLIDKPVLKARRWPKLAASKTSPALEWMGRVLMPAYLRVVLSFRKIEIRNPEFIVDEMMQLQKKRSRLIVAFRHPSGDDPQLLFHVFENLVPREAKKLKKPLLYQTNIRFVHDYAVGLWGGPVIRFFLPRVGALPVYHGTSDAVSLRHIRGALLDGLCPVGIASEGQISYHSETLPRIEQGTARMGFWCARDIERAGRSEDVRILPVSLHMRYDIRDKWKIASALTRMEQFCGMALGSSRSSEQSLEMLAARTEALDRTLLDIVEAYYREHYGYQPQPEPAGEPEKDARLRRWRALFPVALDLAERLLGIDPKDDGLVQRMYRVRLFAWKGIYPYTELRSSSALEAGLLDRHAGEAWYAMRHMELVDLMSYHDVDYLRDQATGELSFDRIAESVVSFQDLINRLLGGNITTRPDVIRKHAVIIPGACISLTQRYPDYCSNPKRAVQEATDALASSFLNCIEQYKNRT